MKWWFNRVRGNEIIDKRREHQARNDHFYTVGKMAAKYICIKPKESFADLTPKKVEFKYTLWWTLKYSNGRNTSRKSVY